MESSPLFPVAPTRPAAPYVGGKRNLARRICDLIQATPHQVYAEVFVGMGGIFLRRQARPQQELINDWSADVANLFRILQRHYAAFLDMLRFQITTRREFERLCATDPATLTDLERAARFIYLQRLAFGGKVEGRNLGVSYGRGAGFNLLKLTPILEELHERLADVVVEQLPFHTFIARYDRPGTLFYCDPPYWGSEDYYGAALFSRDDFQRLSDALRGIRGRFIVSLNDVPEIREIFSWAEIQAVEVSYGLSAKGAVRSSEVIITSPPIERP